MQSASGVVCAELVREFLEFYRLDYSLQIYLPEVNLNQKEAMSKDELARRSGLPAPKGPAETKPLLMQLLESFIAGAPSSAAVAPSAASQGAQAQPKKPEPSILEPAAPVEKPPNTQPQNKRKDDFDAKRGSPDFFSGPSAAGHASAGAASKKSEQEKRLEMANQLLEEQSQEEKSGYRAEIQKSNQKSNPSLSQSQSQTPSPIAPPSRAVGAKDKQNELEDNYENEDDFEEEEEIAEDLPDAQDESDNLLGSANNYHGSNSGGA